MLWLKNCANSWQIQFSKKNASTFPLWHRHIFSRHKNTFVPIQLRLSAYSWESFWPLPGNWRTGSSFGNSTFAILTSHFTNWITGNKRPKPHCYAGNNRYKTKNSYRFNHGQNVLDYGVNRAVRTKNLGSSLPSKTFFVTPTQACRKCFSILRNVQKFYQHNTLEFRDSQSMQCSSEKTCQSNTPYRCIWDLY